ncbi:hypothetical protein [Paenarthrobacter sp. YJN-5]|uniref:hypothetical protein n=1 Tax=Paenarthrobacter sp. YJN-5 TaxID=2735316 RepID=UPI0018786809|nr:hypothetical protein [Paenarthrobacter sp. YJN-5]QOT15868.1 hypothetical protein HMI59_04200 [Paenarthrobacter sp. YJN-5]
MGILDFNRVPDKALPARLQDAALNATYVGKGDVTFNVKDHGALMNGTDDQPAIQALINAINSDPSIKTATIYIPAGECAVGAPIDLPNTTSPTTFMAKPIRIIGAGRSLTKLKAIGSPASFDAVIRHLPPTPLVTGGAPHEIAHMTIDSNKVAKRNIDLINAHAVRVHSLYGLNPALGAYSNIRITGQGTDYLSWENVIGPMVRLEGGGGTDAAQWSDHNLEVLSTDNHILSSVILVRAKVANGVDQGGNNFWTGVHAFYGATHFWQKGSFGSFWDHCEADGPEVHGFRLEGNNNKLIGNHIFHPNSAVPAGFVAGIYLQYPILNSVIMGNTIPDAPAAKKIVSATRVDATTTVTGNPGSLIDTGTNPQGTNFSVQYGDALTTINGSARGAGAVDLQFGRNTVSQVASGAQSFVQGYGNTASAVNSVAMGSLNTSNAFVSEATGARAHTRGTNAKRVRAAGRFAVDGDQQKGEHIVSALTTSTAKTQLTIANGGVASANVVALPSSTSTYLATIKLVGIKKTGSNGEAAYWTITALFRRLASGASSIVKLGSPTWTAGQGDALALTAVPDLTAETLYGHIGVHVTPPDSDEWHWVATIDTVEVA